MKRWTQRVIAALVFGLAANFLDAAETKDLADAVKALEAGVPEVAVVRLQKLAQEKLPNEQKVTVALKLGEALFQSGEAEAALKVLNDPAVRQKPEADFWRAQSYARLNRWADALREYERVIAAHDGWLAEALFGKASALRGLGRKKEALQTFALLFPDPNWSVAAHFRSAELLLEQKKAAEAGEMLKRAQLRASFEKQERRFLRGRVEAAQQHHERAIELFQSLLQAPEKTSRPMLIATLLALADLHLQMNTPEAGDDFLEEFIEHHPNDRALPEIFAQLDRVYQAERKASRSELTRWTRAPEQPRRALAQWYLARAELRVGHRANALAHLQSLRQGGVPLPALAGGYLEYAQLQLDDGHFKEALDILKATAALHPESPERERMEWLRAETQFRARRFAAAAEDFEALARTAPAISDRALFNASLGWLQAGKGEAFRTDYRKVADNAGDQEAGAELMLEQGLTEAAQGNAQAMATLRNFARQFPKNARVSEAWVALAELAFHASPPRLEEARENMRRATQANPTTAAKERADYLQIWIEDAAAGGDEKVIALCNEFLRQHAASRFQSEVRMKLAEAYYRRQDFANAQTQFELLAEQDPNGTYAEKALFFAAESALASMGADSIDRALTLFGEVIKRNGDLKWAARNEQAVVERKLGKPQDALLLYDEVLKEDARPGEKREALCGKGDIYFEMGVTDKENYRRAIQSYDQLLADEQAPPHWRNQALFKKGACQEKLGDQAGALATFYRVLEEEVRPERPREFLWFYKAGFNAARLLEEDSKWTSAASIYQKLASVSGTRSDEAKARLTQLRLEHFLWDQ